MRYLASLFSFILLVFSFNAQNTEDVSGIEFPEDMVHHEIFIEQENCKVTIIAKIDVKENWHINGANLPLDCFSIPTLISVEESDLYTIEDSIIEPKPHYKYDTLAKEPLYLHDGQLEMKRVVYINSDSDFMIKGSFSFQTCDDKHCLVPYEAPFEKKINGCDAEKNINQENISEKEKPNSENKTNKEEEKNIESNGSKEENRSMWFIFLSAFGSGFIALIMPCVFPMIPMTVSFFTKSNQSRANGIKNALLYGGSIVLIHVMLGGIVVITGAGELLNQLSTNVYLNIFFFLILFVFGLSFLGAFEIQLPSKWVNSADAKADKGGIVGIFFMALVLSLASFSCTGPILGSLLGGLSAYGGSTALMIGMFGFGLALALPFMLFAIFPTWLNSMPSSGGWLNVVKVFLGFVEIALAFKFLSTADTTMQWHLLEREIFISIWIAVFGALALYLFGKIRLPHDSPVEKLSVGRSMMATFVLAFTIYLIPGLWGAPLKVVNAFLPPDFYAESPGGIIQGNNSSIETNHTDGMHKGPQGIMAFKDYDKAKAYAQKVNKPLFVDFTGWGCVNCRKMEQTVWGEPGIIEHLRNDVVIVSLYVDERTELPKEEQKTVTLNGREMDILNVGNKWTYKQMSEYKTSSQPFYIMQTPDGKDLKNGSADYRNHGDPNKFKAWLEEGLEELSL